MFLAGHPSQGCFGLQSHCAPCYFFNQASFYPSDFSFKHHCYQCSRPGGSLAHGFTRQDQTLLARFRSGHIKSMKFSEGRKSFEMCMNCTSEPASPAHILECLGLTKQDLADDPLLVLDYLKVYDVMDLV
ncbi:uncharacterized protein TNCV_1495611 [Trichonephila clavipes]|nr:uncharacterized protein TNCV_1495611 [Trichonephila clavipes]